MRTRLGKLNQFAKLNKHGFDRKPMERLRLQLKTYEKWRPSKRRLRKPTNIIILGKMWQFVTTNSLWGCLVAAVFALGYWYGLRSNEYVTTPKDVADCGDAVLEWRNITFTPKHGRPKSAVVQLDKSKTNPTGTRWEYVEALCACNGRFPQVSCGPCALKALLRINQARRGQVRKTERECHA